MKSGLDYFPLDVTLDSKFELLEAEYGLQGFAVIVKLYQRIYGEQGYYCEWTRDVELLFAKRINVGCNFVSEIVNAAVRRGIFNENVYKKYSVLTSKGIQQRFFEAVNRRSKVNVKAEYLLVEVCDLPKNVNILGKNVNNLSENVNISEQGKEKKSRVEYSNIPPELAGVWGEFKKFRVRMKKPLTDYSEQLLLKKLSELSADIETQKAILNQSIVKGWTSVYPLSSKVKQGQSENQSFDMDEFKERAERLPIYNKKGENNENDNRTRIERNSK